ncbi:MAG: inosine/xanthosine triphosphatase [Parachlamydia sp.]|nr:inosine/xanthosine triphosphatase [Parachlamydia sp.]
MVRLLFLLICVLCIQGYSAEPLEDSVLVAVGSTNQVKIRAVETVLKDYPTFNQAMVVSCKVPTEVADQPLSLTETIRGAKKRAKNAYHACVHCKYSIGIESGLMKVRETKSGYMEFTVCCIYDGKEYYLGQSAAYEMPQHIIDLVVKAKMNMAEACFYGGLTTDLKLGEKEGDIGILSKGRMTRQDHSQQALIVALIQLENQSLYAQ